MLKLERAQAAVLGMECCALFPVAIATVIVSALPLRTAVMMQTQTHVVSDSLPACDQ